jgi:hypothetical protein
VSHERDEYRVPVEREGTLRHGDDAVPCTIHDLSAHGVLVEAPLPVSIGDRADLELQLTSGLPVRCTIQVKHVEEGRFGAAIVSISSEDEGNIMRFLEHLTELNLLGF